MTKPEPVNMQDQPASDSRPSPGPNSPSPPAGQPLLWLVLVAVALVGFALFRGGKPGSRPQEGTSGASHVSADGSTRNSPRTVVAPPASLTRSPTAVLREAAILRSLEKPVDVEWIELPLEDALTNLAAWLDVPIHLDRATLAEEAVPVDQPVNLRLQGVTGRSVLHLLLSPLQLEWVIADEVLSITTSGKAAVNLETRVYDVSDLVVVQDENGKSATNFTPLIDLLTGAIDPESWEDQGGRGNIRVLDTGGVHALAVIQTSRILSEIFALLVELREARHPNDRIVQAKSPNAERVQRTKRTPDFFNPLRASRTNAMARGVNLFGLDVYSKLARETEGNVLVSPLSLSYGMALVNAAASGKTADEIARTLHFLLRREDLPLAYYLTLWCPVGGFRYYYTMGMTTIPDHPWWMSPAPWRNEPYFDVTNRLWLNAGIGIREEFRERARIDFLYDGIANLDLVDREAASGKINQFVNPRSGRMLSEIVTDSDFVEPPGFLVTNAATFQARWARPFSLKATVPSKFEAGTFPIEVPMMHLESDFCRYATADGLEILEKPFADDSASMVILLPSRKPGALAELESNLSEVNLTRWLTLEDWPVPEVFLPRFRLEGGGRLRKTLEAMGMRSAFRPEEADFSPMISSGHVNLADVIHRAAIEVEEIGGPPDSKRPRVAHIDSGKKSSEPRNKPEESRPMFRADRPFLFLIRDSHTGSIALIGRVVKPEPLAGNDEPKKKAPPDSNAEP